MERKTRFAALLRLTKIVFFGTLLTQLGCHSKPTETDKDLSGSGSTFVYPLMVQWSSEFTKIPDGCKINYRSLGSGDGIRQISSKKVDFACSDAPMTDEEMSKARETADQILHIPVALGAVVSAYNLPNLKEPLRFTGPVLADIFLGNIKKWNDDHLQKLNPGVALPDRAIIVIHRRDDSGTTYVWTDYLSKVSPQWQTKVGKGHDVKWPAGEAAVGNDGVAEEIKKNEGAIGYLELSHALRKDIAFGLVQNREGEFIKPSLASTSTAASNSLDKIPDDLRFSITDAPGKGAYPIAGTTWALVSLHQPAGKGKAVVKFLEWVVDEGQTWNEGLFFSRLPESLATRAKQKIAQIEVAK